ncbi:oxysterol-binding protein-related 2 isoform X1 [Sigmodon hispidus]
MASRQNACGSIDPVSYESFKKHERRGDHPRKTKMDDGPEKSTSVMPGDVTDDVPVAQETVQVIPGSKLLWRINSWPPNSAQMYNFTSFTVSLNELESGMEKTLPPTDCSLRPDICGMENGNMDLASQEKERLEEKQREARKECVKEETEWQTRWFYPVVTPTQGLLTGFMQGITLSIISQTAQTSTK